MVLLFSTSWDLTFDINSLITGIISGIIASLVFLFIMYRQKPTILISDKIAKFQTPEGETIYCVKFINKTKSTIFDIKVEMCLVEPFNTTGGINYRLKRFQMAYSEFVSIPKFVTIKDDLKNHQYAMVCGTHNNIIETWDASKQSHIMFRVVAKHGLSGYPKVFSKNYHTKKDVVEGNFKSGNTFDIN